MRKFIKYAVAIIVFLYLSFCLLLYFAQESRLFPSQKTSADYVFDYDAKDIFLEVEKDVSIHGLLFESKNPKGILLYFHGNAENIENEGGVCETFVNRNYDCLIFDYRSYGKSDGEIESEDQWFSDADSIVRYAKKISNGKPLSVYGRSLGTSIASYLAGKYDFERVVLEVGPSSFLRLAKESFPFVPVRLIFRFPFENNVHLRNNSNETLVIHGTKDSVVPFSHFLSLKEEFGTAENFKFVEVPGGDHSDLPNFKIYQDALDSFLKVE